MHTSRKAVYLFSASLFFFGSGYSCPPDHIDTNVDEGSGGGAEPDDAWGKFLDRTAKCIELDDDECDGYPGRGTEGRFKGERFPNFMALTCDEDGKPFEFAELFKLQKKDGTPKYKSIVLITGHDS